MIGKTLGHYQITSQLCRGSMGELYQGKRVRNVAIKLNKTHTRDSSPDGKRFLMMKEAADKPAAEAPRKINIVLNWFEELKQRLPVK